MPFTHSESAGEVRRALGSTLRLHRDAAGRTLTAIAEEAGCSPAHLSEVERGLKDVSTDVLLGITYALRVPIARIYSETAEALAPAVDEPRWPADPRARLAMAAGQLSREGLRTVAEFGAFLAMRDAEPPRRHIGFIAPGSRP